MQEQDSWESWQPGPRVHRCSRCQAYFAEKDLSRHTTPFQIVWICTDCRSGFTPPARFLYPDLDPHRA